MVPTAYLKAFEPIEAFDAQDRELWAAPVAPGPVRVRRIFLSARVGLQEILGASTGPETAEVLHRDGRTLACPLRTRLRLLASVLAFRRTIPAEIAPAFMSEMEFRRIVEALEGLRDANSSWKNHILQSSWDIPLRWFVLFEDAERSVLMEDGIETARYETSIQTARTRVRKALTVLRATLPNPAVVGMVAELSTWLDQFDRDGVVVLDYGEVSRLLGPGGLDEDHTARDVWAAIACLEEGDTERAAAYYGAAAERWSRARSIESAN